MKIIYDASGGENFLESSHVDFEGKIGIEIRGKSSQFYPKKQYGFKTWDEKDNDLDVSLLQLPADSDWILYAPYSDKTLLRNFLAYDLSNKIGRYAVRTKFVEVLLNETGDEEIAKHYMGVYLLTERIKVGKERVDIQTLDTSHLSKTRFLGENGFLCGYILKVDKLDEGDSYFFTNFGTQLILVYPRGNKISDKQMEWIKDDMTEFENALSDDNFKDPNHGYAKYIDADSFIDFFILNELFKNVDAYRLSTFMHKDKNGKLKMGPIWDFNIAMGNVTYYNGWKTDRWMLNDMEPIEDYPVPFWWDRLLEDRNFVQKLIDRWKALRKNELETSNILAMIDETAELLADAQRRNFQKWPIFGIYVWPNPRPYSKTYEEEVGKLRVWMKDRINWIDRNIESLLP